MYSQGGISLLGGRMTPNASGDVTPAEPQVRHRPVLTALMEATRSSGTWLKENLGPVVLVLLGALGIATLVLGWVLRPPGAAPPEIPNSPQLAINFAEARPLHDLTVVSYLLQTKVPQAVLKISASGFLGPRQTSVAWSMGVQGFTGRFCTPKAYRGNSTIEPIGYEDYRVYGTLKIPASSSAGSFLVVHLCWKSGAPLTIRSPYFSAALPRILMLGQTGTLTDVLQLRSTSLSSYSPSGGTAPEAVGPGTWAWTSALSGDFGSQAATEVPVSGSSASEIQHENHNAFYSGILFGIAGGAALSVLPALTGVIDRRKARRNTSEEKSDPGTGVARTGSDDPSHAPS
jgi:hypothetical protein